MKILVPVFALILASCASVGERGSDWVDLERESAAIGSILHITGTVHELDLEGGLFVIRDTEGTNYNPTNLSEAFRTDGMAVEVEARRRDDLVSIGMVGPLIELLRIRKHPGGGTVTISGGSITLGPLTTTRKACVEAVMNQENRYLAALQKAERFEIREPFLYWYTAGEPRPLRFVEH